MSTNRFLGVLNGIQRLYTAINTSAGVADADKIVATNSTGKLGSSLLPAIIEAIANATLTGDGYLRRVSGAWSLATPSGSGYTRVNPRDREFENRAISTSGESIALSSIPSTGDYLVHCAFNPGLSAADTLLSIVFASPTDTTKPTPTNINLYAGTSVWEAGSGHYATQGYLYANGGHIWIPANNGSIWARRAGSYLDVTSQSTLDVLGYLAL